MNENERLDLVRKIDERLADNGLWLAVAESCTGGMLGHVISNLSGVSRTFLGGVISYGNSIKQKLLGVQEKTLLAHGAVSAETAAEMALGVRNTCSSAHIPAERIVGVSLTGIAGPAGGSPSKPVGLVWIGVSSAWGSKILSYVGTADRAGNKQQFVEQALMLLLGYLEGIPS